MFDAQLAGCAHEQVLRPGKARVLAGYFFYLMTSRFASLKGFNSIELPNL